jgi:hypothetical protein
MIKIITILPFQLLNMGKRSEVISSLPLKLGESVYKRTFPPIFDCYGNLPGIVSLCLNLTLGINSRDTIPGRIP